MISTRKTASVLLALLLTGCGAANTPEQARRAAIAGDGDVVIAVVWPWQSHRELLFREGIELALDEINRGGGVKGRKLRIITEDDAQSVNNGRLIAQRIGQNPNVLAVIGHLQSYVTIPAAAIYDMAGLLQLAPAATDPELTARGYTRVFRATLTDHAIGSQLADYARQRNYQRVVIFYARAAYGRTLANAFEERAAALGLRVVARNSYDPNQGKESGFGTLFNEWHDLQPDAIFLAGEVPLAGHIIAAIRRAGIDAPILGGDAMNSPGLIEAAGAAADGTVLAAHFHPDAPFDKATIFTRKFRERYGRDPAPGAALGYDAMMLLDQAMERARTLAPDDVTEALRATSGWPGVTGSFTFGATGDLIDRRAQMVIVKNGAFKYITNRTPMDLAAR